MQHLVAGVTEISGPKSFKSKLAVPKPPKPNYFAGMSEQWIKVREDWYEDVSVLAFPTPSDDVVIDELDLKTLKETQPYSIWKHIPRYVRSDATYKELKNNNGKITACTAQDFIDAIFLDGKYSKNFICIF